MESGFALVLLGAALAPEDGGRRVAVFAALVAGLAAAGAGAGGAPRSPGFLAVTGALILVAALLTLGGAGLAARRGDRLGVLASALLLAGAVVEGAEARHPLAHAATGGVALAAAVLVGLGAMLVLLGRFVRFPDSVDGRPRPPWRRADLLGVVGGTAVAAIGPHLFPVIAGTILAVWSGWRRERAVGGSRVPGAPVLVLVLLPAAWLMAVIAGPEGLKIGTLPTLPLSPAAERLLAPAMLLGAWASAGLWPLQRQVPAAILAPVGALLLARVALPAIPDGVEHWRPVAMPVIVLGIWYAALSGRVAGVAVGLAWVGLLAGARPGLGGAALLLSAALGLELARNAPDRYERWRPVARAVAALAGGMGALLTVESGLGAEVVYTMLAAAGVAIIAGRGPTLPGEGRGRNQPMMASARRTTDPKV